MTTRILLAGVLGAIAMFIWSFIGHDLLPLGEAGIREMPNDGPVVDAMKSSIGEKKGFYVFPSFGLGNHPTREQRSEAMKHTDEKFATNPSGMVIYHPPGRKFEFGRLLIVEFVTELAEAIIVVFLLAQTRIGSFSGRVGFIFVAGILAAIATNVSYWNWYGFPGVYTAAYMLIQIVGFLCVGLVAAFVLRKTMFPTA